MLMKDLHPCNVTLFARSSKKPIFVLNLGALVGPNESVTTPSVIVSVMVMSHGYES